MAEVFISYSQANVAHASELATDLKSRGFDVWWDNELYAGQQFTSKIVEEIRKASAVIVIWSDMAAASEWVRSEADIARSQKKLVTVRVPGFDAEKIMPPFRVYHAEDIGNRGHIHQVLARMLNGANAATRALVSEDLLPILSIMQNDELDFIVKYLDAPLINNSYVTVPWFKRIESDKEVKRLWPDHQQYVRVIEREVRRCGGHDIVNLARGEGPTYREIVKDVCKKCGVTIYAGTSVPEMERLLINKLFNDARAKMSSKEWEEVAANLNAEMKRRGYGTPINPALGAPTSAAFGALGIQASGFLTYQYSVIVANALAQQILGHGLSLATNAALTRSIAIFAGPVGWILTGLLTAMTLAGPAFRVTMPCVAHIANRRLERLGEHYAKSQPDAADRDEKSA